MKKKIEKARKRRATKATSVHAPTYGQPCNSQVNRQKSQEPATGSHAHGHGLWPAYNLA